MSSTDLKTRIETALKRRDELSSAKDRVLGRLEEAEKNVESIRNELLAKKIDPDKVDETIQKLESALATSVSELESQLVEAERAIKPFM